MKNNVINLLNEMIRFVDTENYKLIYFQKVNEKIDDKRLSVMFQEILVWNHPVFIDLEISVETELSLKDRNKTDYQNLLEQSSLGDFLFIDNDSIKFNKSVSKEKKKELREFIRENKKVTLNSKETRKKEFRN
ncbi:hypothetical protein [Tenacibaculum jejuense]|uniref:hypothetical protein n=1 Tax=Tenacibaculum jejuense TaxID=584609 RepID=UPI0012FD901B|nr:hypothetical protein [Tenacibaculum jejuense]